MKVKSLSGIQPSATPWTAAYQAPPSMGFSRQEYWSGVPLPSLRAPLVTSKTNIKRILVRLAEQGTLKFWKKKKKTGKNGQNEHFETLKINQRSTETQGALLQEKQLNLSKNSKLCNILTHLHPISHFLSQ